MGAVGVILRPQSQIKNQKSEMTLVHSPVPALGRAFDRDVRQSERKPVMAESNETTIIAGDTHIKGEMTFERAARIVGQFEGKITAKGQLQVADTAICRAEVNAAEVIVDGTI